MTRYLQAASKCGSEVGVLLVESRPVLPLLSSVEIVENYYWIL